MTGQPLGAPIEGWHYVGNPGEPAFQNSWVNYGGVEGPARFLKDPFGIVHLSGLVKLGTVGLTMFVLPTGYRPLYSLRLPTVSAGLFGWLFIDGPTGALSLQGGSNANVELTPVTFPAEQ